MIIRTNITKLEKYIKSISKCNSFNEYCSIFWKNKDSDIDNSLKGSVGENFFDELCRVYPSITGFTSTDFRPSTPDEDYYESFDTAGKTLKSYDGKQKDAIRQDKAYNPFNIKMKLEWDHISRTVKRVLDGEIEDKRYILICTTLSEKQLTAEVKRYFPWRICRNHFENHLKNNNEFFKNFAQRIQKECKELRNRSKENIQKQKRRVLMSHQKDAIKHALKHSVSFIKLPPGSGKTEIAGAIACVWIKELGTIVFIAPGLDLLDQNMYKIVLGLKKSGYKFKTIMVCSRRTWLTKDGKNAFLSEEEIVSGNVEDVKEQLLSNEPKIIGTTYKSYPKVLNFFENYELTFDRIADESVEAIPQKVTKVTPEDTEEEKKLWHSFSNMNPVRKSVCFDAFELESNSIEGPGTNNKNVFGSKFEKSFPEMIELGTIVDLELRPVYVDITEFSNFHSGWWNDDDKINFNALIKSMEDLIADNHFNNKKMIAFLHNATVCKHFVEPLLNYFKHKIDYVQDIVADTKNRSELVEKYKESMNAILLNYGTMGKGIDDPTTPAVLIGRNMASIYGMHGIHRCTRSDEAEYGLSPEKHIKKPFGIAYVVVTKGNHGSEMDLTDLIAMLEKLYSIGWKGKTKLVKLPKTKKKEDDDTEKPEPEDDDVYLEVDEAIQKKISITKQRVSSSDFWNKIEKCNGNYQKELDVLFS